MSSNNNKKYINQNNKVEKTSRTIKKSDDPSIKYCYSEPFPNQNLKKQISKSNNIICSESIQIPYKKLIKFLSKTQKILESIKNSIEANQEIYLQQILSEFKNFIIYKIHLQSFAKNSQIFFLCRQPFRFKLIHYLQTTN